MGTTTPNLGLYKPSVAESGWGSLVNANFDALDGAPRLDDYSIILDGSDINAYDSNGALAFTGTDIGVVLNSCVTALASSAGNPVGSIAIGPGEFPYAVNVNIPPVPASGGVAQLLDPGWLWIHGSGKATQIVNNFSSGAAGFIWFDRAADYDTFGHVMVTDLLWNANGYTGHYAFIGNYDNTTTSRRRVNIIGVRCERIEAINAPTSETSITHVGLAWLVSDHLTSAESTVNHIRDIGFTDCRMIDNGNFGILVSASASSGSDANVLIDEIYLTRCRHTCFHALVSGDHAGNAGTINLIADPTMDDYGLFNATARFPSAGKVNVCYTDETGSFNVNTITYTGKTASTLTGCTGGNGAKTIGSGSCVGLPASDNFIIGNEGHVGLARLPGSVAQERRRVSQSQPIRVVRLRKRVGGHRRSRVLRHRWHYLSDRQRRAKPRMAALGGDGRCLPCPGHATDLHRLTDGQCQDLPADRDCC
jgi:hypothetical protein